MHDHTTHIGERAKAYIQYLIPQHLLSRMAYRISRCRTPWLKNILIKQFIMIFKVDMALAKEPDPNNYSSFNQFFTRELSATGTIVTNDRNILSPVDGRVSQAGNIEDDVLIQAKGKLYTLKQLLTVNELADTFKDGAYINLYLAPKDYHRIHMPLAGELRRMIYVPGKLFAVNPYTVKVINGVFTKNERVINIFKTSIGTMAIVMVGALNVGGMETVWAGQVAPDKNRAINDIKYSDNNKKINLRQGREMGRFNMGSTVILLFSGDTIRWSPKITAGETVTVGGNIASLKD